MPDCTIVIEVGVDLINELTNGIVGSMTFGGVPFGGSPHASDGKFTNKTMLVCQETAADSSPMIILANTTNLADVEGAEWVLDECFGTMVFDRAVELDGNFVMTFFEGGTFEFNQNVATCGDLELYACNAGGFTFATDKTFTYVGFVTNNVPFDCANPGSSLADVCGDTDGFEIDTDASALCGD